MQIAIIVLFTWFLFFLLGQYQLNRIKKKLFAKIDERVKTLEKAKQTDTLDSFYAHIFADWDTVVKSNAWFVLSANELYPVPANPQRLKDRLKLTPAWLSAYLHLQGTDLEMTESQRTSVEEILALVPENQRK